MMSSNFVAVCMMAFIAMSNFFIGNKPKVIHLVPAETIQPVENESEQKLELPKLIDLDQSCHLEPIQKLHDGLVLLDFHATWCAPCKKQSTVFDQMARSGQIQGGIVVKIDIDRHPDLTRLYNIKTVPTLILTNKGAIQKKHAGMLTDFEVAKLFTVPTLESTTTPPTKLASAVSQEDK